MLLSCLHCPHALRFGIGSHAVWSYAKPVHELEQMVERMILQSMGVEKLYDSLTESLAYGLRLSEYGAAPDQETAMPEHFDPTMLTVVCQYQKGGLEVQTRDGEWIDVVPRPNSFNVMLGEAYRVCNPSSVDSLSSPKNCSLCSFI